MNRPFTLSSPGLMPLRVFAHDGIDDEAPIPLKIRANATEVFQHIRIKRHPGPNLGLNHVG